MFLTQQLETYFTIESRNSPKDMNPELDETDWAPITKEKKIYYTQFQTPKMREMKHLIFIPGNLSMLFLNYLK